MAVTTNESINGGGSTTSQPGGTSTTIINYGTVETGSPVITAADDLITTDAQASYFAHQAIMGPTWTEIQAIKTRGSRKGWLRDQMDSTVTTPPIRIVDLYNDVVEPGVNLRWAENWRGDEFGRRCQPTWWLRYQGSNAFRGRITWALLKHMPVSQDAGSENAEKPAGNAYTDMLCSLAFTTMQEVLEAVTYSGPMARMLTYGGNEKAVGINEPDENYAREIMQLFTIGLLELNLDGSEKTDIDGNFIKTYTNDDIRQVARVFTGLFSPDITVANGYTLTPNAAQKLALQTTPVDEFDTNGIPYSAVDGHLNHKLKHALWAYEWGAKNALSGRINIPAVTPTDDLGVAGRANITLCIQQLLSHPSCAPFLAKQFIKMLVKSNPTPQYIARVASVFQNNGKNQVGNLKAFWQAIYCDPEATYPGTLNTKSGRWLDGFEVVMRAMRCAERRTTIVGLGSNPDKGGFYNYGNSPDAHRAAFGTNLPNFFPSIFGGYEQLGSKDLLIEYGLDAPEATGWNASTLVGSSNAFISNSYLHNGERGDAVQTFNMRSDYSMFPLTGTATELVDRINYLYLGGGMSSKLHADCLAIATPMATGTTTQQDSRVTVLLGLVSTSPDMYFQF